MKSNTFPFHLQPRQFSSLLSTLTDDSEAWHPAPLWFTYVAGDKLFRVVFHWCFEEGDASWRLCDYVSGNTIRHQNWLTSQCSILICLMLNIKLISSIDVVINFMSLDNTNLTSGLRKKLFLNNVRTILPSYHLVRSRTVSYGAKQICYIHAETPMYHGKPKYT
jgi:hypothetical protein